MGKLLLIKREDDDANALLKFHHGIYSFDNSSIKGDCNLIFVSDIGELQPRLLVAVEG